MKEPRVKDNDPNNTLYAGSDLYDYAFDLHYAPSFQCPDITECIPPTLRAMLRAIPRVANLEGYATGCKNALKETMYLSTGMMVVLCGMNFSCSVHSLVVILL